MQTGNQRKESAEGLLVLENRRSFSADFSVGQPTSLALRPIGSHLWASPAFSVSWDPWINMAERIIPHAYPMSVDYEMSSPRRIYDQNFAEALTSQDLLAPTLFHGYYIRPRINKQLERGFSQVDNEDDWYRVQLDVCQFMPSELSVRTVDNLLEAPRKSDDLEPAINQLKIHMDKKGAKSS
ncbi:hypothetical protein AAFF_G00134520 [Aldrovandia affinis]|uniref:Alpha-crystallin N-terminal domain-containing protein n=1 Tax=Aldrovandia affinis TaxID=143900 RepID=A0AAD7RPZ5_9TELE|nr:hypothetical protein AAFF_G00134520 [Aldrovandia affinis]